MVEPVRRKACVSDTPDESDTDVSPAIWPLSLMAHARLKSNETSPSVPRSVNVPFCQRNACSEPLLTLRCDPPTTAPLLLTAKALLNDPPSVPRFCFVEPFQRKAMRLPLGSA